MMQAGQFAARLLPRYVVLWCTFFLTPAWAHPPGLSSLELSLQAGHLAVKATFALQDIEAFAPMDSDLDAEVSDAERDAAKPAVAAFVAGKLAIAADGEQLAPEEPASVDYDAQNNAHVQLRYQPAPKQTLALESKFLAELPEGHQQFLQIRSADGRILQEKMLSRADDKLQISVSGGNDSGWATVFWAFFKLGVEHIVTGYDHLLFLFALLAVTHSFWPAIKIITFFTVAHSLTLALAGLNLIALPSSFVEPFIAATIVYVALENLIRGDHTKGRHWLTFFFGLIHGFGFASVLQELEIGTASSGILLPLLSFNLGIETGQIAVAVAVLPIIWQLNGKTELAPAFLKTGSLLVALMGGYWFLERTVL